MKYIIETHPGNGLVGLTIVAVHDGHQSQAAAITFKPLGEDDPAAVCLLLQEEKMDAFLQAMVECAYKRGILPADLGKAIQPMIEWKPSDPRDLLVAALKEHIADLRRMLFDDGRSMGTVERAYAAADDLARGASTDG